MKSKNNNNNIEISEKQVPEKEKLALLEHQRCSEQLVEVEPKQEQEPKPKKVLTESQLEALAKARIKAQERKQELKELNAKSKGLKEEKLKADAAEFDRLQQADAQRRGMKKELDEIVQNIEVKNIKPTPERKKKIKKIIYEDETDEESVEEVIIKRKPKVKETPAQPSYEQLANMSVEQQIKNKLQQEKITCFFNQLTGKKY